MAARPAGPGPLPVATPPPPTNEAASSSSTSARLSAQPSLPLPPRHLVSLLAQADAAYAAAGRAYYDGEAAIDLAAAVYEAAALLKSAWERGLYQSLPGAPLREVTAASAEAVPLLSALSAPGWLVDVVDGFGGGSGGSAAAPGPSSAGGASSPPPPAQVDHHPAAAAAAARSRAYTRLRAATAKLHAKMALYSPPSVVVGQEEGGDDHAVPHFDRTTSLSSVPSAAAARLATFTRLAGGLGALVDADWASPALERILPGLTLDPFLDVGGMRAAPDSAPVRAPAAGLLAAVREEALRGAGPVGRALAGAPLTSSPPPAQLPLRPPPPLPPPLAGPAVGGTAAAALRHPGLQALWVRAGGAHADRLPWSSLWGALFEGGAGVSSAGVDGQEDDPDEAAAAVAVQALALSETARAAVVSAVGGRSASAALPPGPSGPTCSICELDDVVGPAVGGLAGAEASAAVALAALQGGLVPPSIAAEAAGHLPPPPDAPTVGLDSRAADLAATFTDGSSTTARAVWVTGLSGLGKATATAAAARLLLDSGAWSAVRWVEVYDWRLRAAQSDNDAADALGTAIMHAYGGTPAPGVCDLTRVLSRIVAVGGERPALVLRVWSVVDPPPDFLSVLHRLQDVCLTTVVVWDTDYGGQPAPAGTTIPRLTGSEVEALLVAHAPAAAVVAGGGGEGGEDLPPSSALMEAIGGLPGKARLVGAWLDRPWLMEGCKGALADRADILENIKYLENLAAGARATATSGGAAHGAEPPVDTATKKRPRRPSFLARSTGSAFVTCVIAAGGEEGLCPALVPPGRRALWEVLVDAGMCDWAAGRSLVTFVGSPFTFWEVRGGVSAASAADLERVLSARLVAAGRTAAAGAPAAAARVSVACASALNLRGLALQWELDPVTAWTADDLSAAAGVLWDGGALLPPVLGAAAHARACDAVAQAAAEKGDKAALARALWAGGAALGRRGEWAAAATVLAGAREAVVAAGTRASAHPDASRILASLAQATYKASGDVKSAQDLYAAAYAARPGAGLAARRAGSCETVHRLSAQAGADLADALAGEDDGDLLDGAAGLLRVSGAERDAEALYRAALAHRLHARGPGHPAALAAANNLAVLLGSAASIRIGSGDRHGAAAAVDEAEVLHRTVLGQRLAATGPASLAAAGSAFNLGALLARWPPTGMDSADNSASRAAPSARLPEAAAHLAAAASAREAVLGLHHPLVWDSWAAQVPVLAELGRGAEAAALATAVHDSRRAAAGGAPPACALPPPASLAYAHAAAALATLQIDAWAAAAAVGVAPAGGGPSVGRAAALLRAALPHVGWTAAVVVPGSDDGGHLAAAVGLPSATCLAAASAPFAFGSGGPSPAASAPLHLARAALALASGRAALAVEDLGRDDAARAAGRAGLAAVAFSADTTAALLGGAAPPALAARAAHMEWSARSEVVSSVRPDVLAAAERQAGLAGLPVSFLAAASGGCLGPARAPPACREAFLLGSTLALAHAARGATTSAALCAAPALAAWDAGRLRAAAAARTPVALTMRRAYAAAHLATLPGAIKDKELTSQFTSEAEDTSILAVRVALPPAVPALGRSLQGWPGLRAKAGPAAPVRPRRTTSVPAAQAFYQHPAGDTALSWGAAFVAAHARFLACALDAARPACTRLALLVMVGPRTASYGLFHETLDAFLAGARAARAAGLGGGEDGGGEGDGG